MKKRKPIVLIDGNEESKNVIELFNKNNIEYVTYDIKNFETNCCADLPTTKVPSVIASEGIFRELDQIHSYIEKYKNSQNEQQSQSESSYW